MTLIAGKELTSRKERMNRRDRILERMAIWISQTVETRRRATARTENTPNENREYAEEDESHESQGGHDSLVESRHLPQSLKPPAI